jgi:hypothetical protein
MITFEFVQLMTIQKQFLLGLVFNARQIFQEIFAYCPEQLYILLVSRYYSLQNSQQDLFSLQVGAQNCSTLNLTSN